MEAAAPLPASVVVPATAAAADSPAAAAGDDAARSEATEYLSTLLNKMLLVQTTDGRLFSGTFKCTDWDCNVVLAQTTEFREPSRRQREAAAEAAAASGDRLVMNMQERDLGLVVVPGKYIVKIEVEEFASQLRQRAGLGAGLGAVQ